MKAVIQAQGRQFTVQTGDVLKMNRYPDSEAGSIIEVKEVLMCEDETGVQVGTPILNDRVVRLKVLENKRDKKIVVLKHRRRGGFQRKQGHRQALSVVKVESIDKI